MGKSRNKPPPSKLRDAFVDDLTSVWEYVQDRFSSDQPYAIALYGAEGGAAQLYPQVLTEAGLAKVAQRYVDEKIYDTVAEGIQALRYSVADSPWFYDFVDRLPRVKALCAPFADQMYEDNGYKLLSKAAVDAFKLLDARGLFGRGPERDQILLVVIVEDTEVEYSLETAKAANPAAVFERYKKYNEPEGPYQSIDSISIAQSGEILFAARTRANPKAQPGSPGEFIWEFVGYDVEGSILKQRWVFDLGSYEASGLAVRCAQDGLTVVCIARYYQDGRQHLLVRLDARTGKLLQQFAGVGEPASLAISPDGAHVAVGTHGGALLLYDAAFELRHKISTKLGNNGLLFLRSTGELLVGGRCSILFLDPATATIKATIEVPGFRLSASADESMLIASQYLYPKTKSIAFGVAMISLPDCHLIREIHLPEKQLGRAVLRPDGRYLAAVAYPIEGYIGRAVIVDCDTGQPVFDEKLSDMDIAFFPDNRRVAFAMSHRNERPPVKIVELPG